MGRIGTVRVFGIKPGSIGETEGYGYPYWEPEPKDASAEQLHQWEQRNPIWGFADEVGTLDQDDIEFFNGDDRNVWDYMKTYIKGEGDIDALRDIIGHCDTFILVFDSAYEAGTINWGDTQGAIYAGNYECTFSY